MDGAGVMRRMRDIQLPLLAPTFFFILVINITDSFTDSFGIVDTLNGDKPVQEALDTAVSRSNEIMARFAQTYAGKSFPKRQSECFIRVATQVTTPFRPTVRPCAVRISRTTGSPPLSWPRNC